MADFEDSHSPTWEATLQGQINLRDAIRRTIATPAREGKNYALKSTTATLLVRPRGWHLDEKHVPRRRPALSGSLFDFGLFFFHNASALLARGTGPVLLSAQAGEPSRGPAVERRVRLRRRSALGLPDGTIRRRCSSRRSWPRSRWTRSCTSCATTPPGLNCGRWDYIFSFIKKFRADPTFVLPDRAQVTMTTHFLRSLLAAADQDLPPARRARDGRHGGADPDQGRPGGQRGRARQGPRRQAARGDGDGHDGTWVAHPGLVPVAQRIFDRHDAGRPISSRQAPRRRQGHGRRPARGARGARSPRPACATTQRRRPVPRILAARQRLRADPQPDGRRRHGRDLARRRSGSGSATTRALLADGRARRRSSSSRAGSPKSWTSIRAESATRLRRRHVRDGRPSFSTRCSRPTSSTSS